MGIAKYQRLHPQIYYWFSSDALLLLASLLPSPFPAFGKRDAETDPNTPSRNLVHRRKCLIVSLWQPMALSSELCLDFPPACDLRKKSLRSQMFAGVRLAQQAGSWRDIPRSIIRQGVGLHGNSMFLITTYLCHFI